MRDKIKLKLTFGMMLSLQDFVAEAVINLSVHETPRDRYKLMLIGLIAQVNRKIAMKFVDHKKTYSLTLTVPEGCALHGYYSSLGAYITDVTLIIGEIDKHTA